MVINASASRKAAGEKTAGTSPHNALVEFAIKKGDAISAKFDEKCNDARRKMDGGERLSRSEWQDLLSLEYLLKIRSTKMLKTGKVMLDPRMPNFLLLKTGAIGLREKSEFLKDRLAVLVN